MESTRDSLEKAVDRWRRGHASLEEVRTMTRQLGNERVESGIPALLQLLDHEDSIVRYNAAMALGFELHHRPSTEKLLTILSLDPDDDVRDVAAGSLRTLWQNTKNAVVIQALANAALGDPDEGVRESAYKGLLIVNGLPDEQHLRLLTGGKVLVDAARVQTILGDVRRGAN